MSSRATSKWPWRAAAQTDNPASAPFCSSNLAQAVRPSWAAAKSGVLPKLSANDTSAFASINASTAKSWPAAEDPERRRALVVPQVDVGAQINEFGNDLVVAVLRRHVEWCRSFPVARVDLRALIYE